MRQREVWSGTKFAALRHGATAHRRGSQMSKLLTGRIIGDFRGSLTGEFRNDLLPSWPAGWRAAGCYPGAARVSNRGPNQGPFRFTDDLPTSFGLSEIGSTSALEPTCVIRRCPLQT